MNQLALPIDWHQVEKRRLVVLGDANRAAIAFLERPALWPSHCALLVGPRRSGRSTIARMIVASGAAEAIDDADQQPEAAIFHAWNRARETGSRLLLVARHAPPRWSVGLPDLASRLSASGVARIERPDELLMEALIADGLGALGVAFSTDLPRWLAPRLPRAYTAVDTMIGTLNEWALASGQRITPTVARSCLDRLAQAEDDGSHDDD